MEGGDLFASISRCCCQPCVGDICETSWSKFFLDFCDIDSQMSESRRMGVDCSAERICSTLL